MKKECILVIIITILFIKFLPAQDLPNVIFIYADDLGYGDLSCYGAVKLNTPHIDILAAKGLRFTNAHTTSATCTPSRYALMTGRYPWRKAGTGVLPGNAALIIPQDEITLPSLFQKKGYTTGIVGKWHLGLGNETEKNWNGEIKPGPNEVGFDYSFIFPATADRTPTVFIENRKVTGLQPNDSIFVDYRKKVGNDPTGKENPELLKMKATHGHDQTIVNGIGRIGYMSGGKTARWNDEELSFTFLEKAREFIVKNKNKPFFLYYAVTEPHVPRMPATIFKGKSGLGYRGDAILQFDWSVGKIMDELKLQGLDKNTIIIISSDNGPVLDDGYDDGAVTMLNGHTPSGVLRGGKYSSFEGGTRIPMIVFWPTRIKPAVSDALISQVDFKVSFAKFLKIPLSENERGDSFDMMDVLLGKSKRNRDYLVEDASILAIQKDGWKYIEPSNRQAYDKYTNTELGNDALPQLYNLKNDIGERKNVARQYPEIVKNLADLLQKVKNGK